MGLNVIDISGWQKGLDLPKLFSLNPDLDGVIVKSTGGVSYVQSTCDPWVQAAKQCGKLWGFYHFVNDDNRGADPITEADFWYGNCKNYFHHGIPFVDYEGNGLKCGTGWLKRFLDRIHELTGVKAVVYTYSSALKQQDFSQIVAANHGLWVANYPGMAPTGFKQIDKCTVPIGQWPFAMGWQYASTGRLNGYNGNLDLNVFFGDAETWAKYAGSSTVAKHHSLTPDVVKAVLNGKYGNGDERIAKLTAEGYDPEIVQSKIDDIYDAADTVSGLRKNIGADYWSIVLDHIK